MKKYSLTLMVPNLPTCWQLCSSLEYNIDASYYISFADDINTQASFIIGIISTKYSANVCFDCR